MLIADSQRLVGDALATRLALEEGIVILATANKDAQACLAARVMRPDVVVVGALSYGVSAADMTRRLREAMPEVRVVVIGDDEDPRSVCDCLCEGAHAWLAARNSSTVTLVQAIRDAMSDQISVPPRMLTSVIRGLQARRSDREEDRARLLRLSDRERAVLDCMVAGVDRDAIAKRLGVSRNTIRTHTQNCYAKLGVHSSLEAVHFAFRCGVRPSVIGSAGSSAVPGDHGDYRKRVRVGSSAVAMRATGALFSSIERVIRVAGGRRVIRDGNP